MPGSFDPAAVPWSLILAFGSLAVIFLLFRKRADAFAEIGFSSKEVWLLALGSMAGWAVDIPLVPLGNSYLAVNLGGAVIPVVLVFWWIRQGKLRIGRAVVGTFLVSLTAFAIVRFEPTLGIIAEYPWFFLPPGVAFAFALVTSPRSPLHSVPVAYTAGSIGALVGADLFNTPELANYYRASGEGAFVSIGGAGAFDMVFIAGALAMALDLAVVLAVDRVRGIRDVAPGAVGASEAYPATPLEVSESHRAWDAFVRLPDPNPVERAASAIALSNVALAEADYPRATRFAWHAVHTLIDASPAARERVRDGSPLARDAALLARVAARARDAGHPRVAPVTRREAGDANDAAKLVVGTLAPAFGVASRLEGF